MLASIVGFTKTSFARISNLSCKGAVVPGLKPGLMLVKTPALPFRLLYSSSRNGRTVNTIAPEYIAGLIEGDGSIKVPSTLAEILAKKLEGTLNKTSGNWYVLSIYKLSALHELAKLVNGKFRTPKIEALHRLINWLNYYGKFEKINILPADNSNILSNSWLAGYSDCALRTNFLISLTTSNLNIAKNIQLTYRLSQRQEYHRESSTGISYLNILTTIATAFLIKPTLYERERINPKTNKTYSEKGYLVTVKGLESRIALINYFTKFPLLSSKYLDYLN